MNDVWLAPAVFFSECKRVAKAAELAFDEAFFLNEEDFEAALGMARSYEGLGDNYLNGEKSKVNKFDPFWTNLIQKNKKKMTIFIIKGK